MGVNFIRTTTGCVTKNVIQPDSQVAEVYLSYSVQCLYRGSVEFSPQLEMNYITNFVIQCKVNIVNKALLPSFSRKKVLR